jgi:hypothetical protein
MLPMVLSNGISQLKFKRFSPNGVCLVGFSPRLISGEEFSAEHLFQRSGNTLEKLLSGAPFLRKEALADSVTKKAAQAEFYFS